MKKIVIVFVSLVILQWAHCSVVADLRALYPNLTTEDLQNKKSGVKNAFNFFRTYVPYYYSKFAPITPSLTPSALADAEGWCVGDAHPENFGIVLDDQGNDRFTINDWDDAGYCPLVADALRFFAAAQLANETTSEPQTEYSNQPLIKTYLGALGGEISESQITQSSIVRDLLAKSLQKNEPKKTDIVDHHLAEDLGDLVSPSEAESLQIFVQQTWSSYRFTEARKYKEPTGGSGGLWRYRVLLNHADHEQVLEFKQLAEPGIAPLKTRPIVEIATHYELAFSQEVAPLTRSEFYRAAVLSFSHSPTSPTSNYFVRPRWRGLNKIELKELSASDLQTVLLDEARTLGFIHRRSAVDLEKYRAVIGALTATDWDSEISKIVQQAHSAASELNAH